MKATGKRWLLTILACASCITMAATEAPALNVTATMPKGEVRDLTQITVRFSEPMRALGVMDQQAEGAPLRLSASGAKLPPGNFRWLDPATLAYIFDEPVAVPLTITATVPKGVTSLAGKSLAEGASWGVSTPPLTIGIYNQAHLSPLPKKDALFYLQSNYPLNMQLLRAKLQVAHKGNPLSITIAKASTGTWHNGRPGSWHYPITIKSALPPNSSVTVTLDQGARAEKGGKGAGKFTATLPTYTPLAVEAWYFDGNKTKDAARGVSPESALTITLNNPVPYREALRHITVSPKAESALREERDGNATYIQAPYLWKPRTTYTVTLKKGLKDSYGTELAKDETLTFTTGDYRPLAHVPGGSDAVLETPVADIFPVTLRNAGKFTVSLRYIPWGEGALAVMRDDTLTPGKAVSGTRKTEILLDVTKTPNANIREVLDIPKALGFASATEMNGLVVLSARTDVQEIANNMLRKHLQFTNLGLAARIGEKSGLVWTTNLTSGKPVAEAAIRIADANGATLWKGKTGEAGTVVLPGYDKLYGARFCIAEAQDGASVLDLGKYLVPASAKEYEKIKAVRIPWRIHAVAQLPLYQPGQTVNATLIARRHADTGKGALEDFADWKALPDTPLSLEVKDRQNTVVYAAESVTDAYGAVPFSFTLSPSAEPGWYRVTAKQKGADRESAVYAFQVASFRPPDVKVDLTAPESQPVPAKDAAPLSVDIAAAYFSGSAVGGGSIELDIAELDSYFTPASLRGYRVGPDLWPFRHGYSRPRSAQVTGTLSGEGKASLTLPAFKPEQYRPANIFLTATVTDAARLTTQGTASFLLHPSEYYVGLRTSFIALPNRDTPFHIKAATWNDKALTGKAVTVTAYRVTWAKEEVKETPVWERTLTLEKATGDSFDASFPTAGEYRVIATITDDAGRANIAATRVYVPGHGGDWVRTKPGRRLEFLHEDTIYEPGKTARVVLKNPFGTATALVAIERDGVLRSFVTEVSGEAPLIEIPLEKVDAPYVYATITLVKGRTAPPPDASSPEGAADEGMPAFAQGTLLLKVAGAREKLAVTVTSDKQEYRPGAPVKATAAVTSTAGKGVKAQVTFLAVDERYLRAAGEHTRYNPAGTFGEQYPNAMQSSDLWRYILNRAIPVSLNAEMKMRAKGMLAMPSTAAGEALGQAPGQDTGGDTTVRANFTPLAFWLAAKETDDSGKLAVTFTLPDTVTSYRIVAVAYDTKSAFAVGEASVTASKPLQILSALPKFATEGDTLHAAVLLQNTGKTPGEATLSVTLGSAVTGSALREKTRTVPLEAGESKRVSFPLDIGSLTEADQALTLEFSAKMHAGGVTETDAARFVLPVKPARPLTTVAAAGLLKKGETMALPVSAPANLDPRSRMVVTFAPSPAAGIPLAMKQVAEYPWNCLEQRLSRTWARILRVRHGELLGLAPDPADKGAILAELDAVPAYQGSDGAFRFWPRMSHADGNLFLTSYALIVADAAKQTGMPLPGETVASAITYVEKRLSGRQKDRSVPPDTMALALHALSLHKPEKSRTLFPAVWKYCQNDETTPLGYAALLFCLKQAKVPGEAATATAIRERIEKTAAVTATETHFASPRENAYWRTLGSKLRDNAYVLAAFAVANPDYPRLESLARWVGQRLGDEKTLSTQEAVFGMWGLVSYLQTLVDKVETGKGQEIAISALWNNKDEAAIAFKSLMDAPSAWVIAPDRLNGGNDSTLRLTATTGRPYWTARLAYASPAVATRVENSGFTISRTLAPGEGTHKPKGHTGWKIGDTVQVSLTITVPATRRHVVLFDPFPAGFEPLFASRVDVTATERTWQPPWQWQDALDDGMLLYAAQIDPGTYTFTYTLRAAAGGTFVQRPAYVEEMYTPETFGRTDAGQLNVSE